MLKRYHYVAIATAVFALLIGLNALRTYYDIQEYLQYGYDDNRKELQIIIQDMQKISNALYENIINKPDVINIFKAAADANETTRDRIRKRLYGHLQKPYATFVQYGIQQLHFHLPDNRSFLRFHRPEKYDDNLTGVRASVSFVNKFKKPISGFEEGKIFNGYRFVYPMFDETGRHIGSVEVSSSLLEFKKIYQNNSSAHIDFILSKSRVHEKLFVSERSNYRPYWNLDDFLIQTTLYDYDVVRCRHKDDLKKAFLQLSRNDGFLEQLAQLKPIRRIVYIDNRLFGINFMPLYNDFTNEIVGYAVIFHQSHYLDHFLKNNIVVLMVLFLISIAIGFLLYYSRRALMERREKDATRRINQQLNNTRQLLSSVINSTDDLIFYKDSDLHYIGCNRSFEALVGKNESEIIGTDDFALFDKEAATRFRNNDLNVLQECNILTNYEWVVFPDGRHVYMQTKKIPFAYEDSGKNGILGVARDMTDIHQMQLQLEAQSYIDDLTHIENRKAYNKRLYEQISLFHRYGTPFSMMLFDIDNFKAINDTYGHDTGDRVLQELALVVRHCIRENDHFYRIGGEEFVVLFPQTAYPDALTVTEKIRAQIASEDAIIKGRKITISAGLTQMLGDDDPETIFKRVDTLLYEAKDSGKNCIRCDRCT